MLDARKARKVLLLQDSQSEVLVLTSRSLLEAWSLELIEALESCAQRGLAVRVLVDGASPESSRRLSRLALSGAEVRQSPRAFPWTSRLTPVHGETWIFDRSEVIAVNERKGASHKNFTLVVECLMGSEVAHGAAAYFNQRWNASAGAVAFYVRHKSYTLLSGRRSANEFYGCLLTAKKEVCLSLPGGRLAKAVENALHSSLASGVQVTIYVNAEREDAPALKRLRRLAMAGAVLKICGRRLSTECAVIDRASVYMGSLPSSWAAWSSTPSPVFLLQNTMMSGEILAALEGQVSVEITAAPQPQSFAFR